MPARSATPWSVSNDGYPDTIISNRIMPRLPLLNATTVIGRSCSLAVSNSPISMVSPPSPDMDTT